jgi:hypothetical protein
MELKRDNIQLGMVVHIYNLSYLGGEAGGS